MSDKSYSRGGRRRTIQMSCGQTFCGHPNEVNKKYERHIRCCELCKDTEIKKAPEFDSVAGYNNGWKGLSNQGNRRPNEMMTSVSCDGLMFNTTTPCNSIDKSMNMLNDPEYKRELLETQMQGFTQVVGKRDFLEEIFDIKMISDKLKIELRCWKASYTKEELRTWTMQRLEILLMLIGNEVGVNVI